MEKTIVENEDNFKSQTLTLRLLKEKIPISNALNPGHGYTLVESERGDLYIDQSESSPPAWSGFVSDYTRSDISSLANKHCSAVLFIKVHSISIKNKRRIMALTFGYGHNALNTSSFERNFGLKVTLSAVTRTELISLDTATLDSTVFQRRIQASKKANFLGFGMNIERDLLRLAGGIPSDTTFASMLVGKDALTITCRTSPEDFLSKCSKALDLFYSRVYKKEFDFIDHISQVDNVIHKNFLDSFIFSEIKKMVAGNASDLHLIIPEVMNPEASHEVGYYGSGFNKGTKNTFPRVDVSDYISELVNGDFSSIKTFDAIKSGQHIYEVFNGVKNQKSKRKIYDCFVFEIEISSNKNRKQSGLGKKITYPSRKPADFTDGVYVLFSGDWYLVDKVFHMEIEKFYRRYLSSTPFLKSTKSKNEKELISELNKHTDLLNLDQVKINPLGTSNANIEPCDFLSKNKQFIHLKDGESSGPISHLWNQGIVSAEAYLSDLNFRKELNESIRLRQNKFKKMGFTTLLPKANIKVDTSKLTIIFGVMRTPYIKTSQAGLPFFSKVSFRPVVQTLERMGYRVELHLIEKI